MPWYKLAYAQLKIKITVITHHFTLNIKYQILQAHTLI